MTMSRMSRRWTPVDAPSIDYVLGWSSLKRDTQRKLLWENAVRFYKQT